MIAIHSSLRSLATSWQTPFGRLAPLVQYKLLKCIPYN